MDIRLFDDGVVDDATGEVDDVLFILGWGNRCRQPTVQWLIDRVATRFRVHVAELPTHITDFQREWVAPIREYAADLGTFSVLAHSAGGLTAAHLDLDGIENRVYLSPWWGSDFPAPEFVLRAIAALPVTKPALPTDIGADALGELVTDARPASPTSYSPAFLRTIRRAQDRLPLARQNAVAFCTLTDAVVDPRAVGRRVPADRIRLYDGGHELFSSASRDTHIETVLTALERGPVAL